MRPAVVLFSGGLDSSTCLAIAREDGFAPHALAVRYGQRHDYELTAAERVARALGAPLKVISLDLRAIGGSALTGDLDVPKDAPIGGGIPITYVPARNTVLLALALGYAETLDAQDLYLGVSGLPAGIRPGIREARQRRDRRRRGGPRQLPRPRAPAAAHQGADHPARRSARRSLRIDPFLLRPRRAGPCLRPLRFLPAARAGISRSRRPGPDGVLSEVNHADASDRALDRPGPRPRGRRRGDGIRHLQCSHGGAATSP